MPVQNDQQFHIYSVGMVYTSVCTSLEAAEAEARLNRDMPSGIESPWKLALEPFASGEENGCVCPDKPATHRHLLFSC